MGFLITIEGIEGSGKSSLIKRLAALLDSDISTGRIPGIKQLMLSREPGATEVGQLIRSILLDSSIAKINPLTELLLFAADRAQHVEELLRPALSQGTLILCDRYLHSTLAYQGYARMLDMNCVSASVELAINGLRPDLVLLLDLDPVVGLQRAKSRCMQTEEKAGKHTAEDKSSWNRFEEQEIEFHRRVREGFLSLSKNSTDEFVVLDATTPADKLAEQAYQALIRRIEIEAKI